MWYSEKRLRSYSRRTSSILHHACRRSLHQISYSLSCTACIRFSRSASTFNSYFSRRLAFLGWSARRAALPDRVRKPRALRCEHNSVSLHMLLTKQQRRQLARRTWISIAARFCEATGYFHGC